MEKDLTKGPILKTLLLFALPMILGNLLQQIYNITDTIIVGRVLGSGALAAVGSTYTLMTFLTSVMIGLCMGCGALFSMHYGAGHQNKMKECMWISFWLILLVTVIMYLIVFPGTDGILNLLQTPADIYRLMRTYSRIIFLGIGFTFLYNYFAFVLRAVGNSVLPLIFLAISSLLNIALDLWFRTAFRCRRCGRCHGNCPGGIRHRYYDCCTLEKPTAVSVKRTAYFSKKYTF